jgi:hypothetical protein
MKQEFVQLICEDGRYTKKFWHIPTKDGSDVMCKSFNDPKIIAVRFTSEVPKPLCRNCARICARWLFKPVSEITTLYG